MLSIKTAFDVTGVPDFGQVSSIILFMWWFSFYSQHLFHLFHCHAKTFPHNYSLKVLLNLDVILHNTCCDLDAAVAHNSWKIQSVWIF